MHDFLEPGPTIPAFLAKLWKLVDDPETDNLICWNDSGQSFIITDTLTFTRDLLPKYYKHNNLASFIRQLNMYGFHKVVSIESGGLKSEKDYMEFSHTCFVKDHPYLMENIKRKMPTRTAATSYSFARRGENSKEMTQSEILAKVLADVNNLKGKQASWDQKLASMKRENEALWRELAIFRQKHLKQEQIINRLIQFIVEMVRPTRPSHPSLRRRLPLMLNDSPQAKVPRKSTFGPTIHEVDPMEQLLGRASTSRAARRSSPVDFSLGDDNGNDSSYFVVSPEDDSSSPWSPELEDPAMTPINPYEVTPDKSGPSPNQRQPSVEVRFDQKPLLRRNGAAARAANRITSVKKTEDTRQTATVPKKISDNSEPVAERTKHKAAAVVKKSRKSVQPKKARRKTADSDKDKDQPAAVLDEFEGECLANEGEENKIDPSAFVTDDNPFETSSSMNVDLEFPEDAMAIARPNTNVSVDDVARVNNPANLDQGDLGNHVDQVQGDIDFLKDILKGDGYNFDANTLLELFNEDPVSFNAPAPNDDKSSKSENEGNELMMYNPSSLVDFTDLYSATPMAEVQASPAPGSPSGLETPIMTPASPLSKRRRK